LNPGEPPNILIVMEELKSCLFCGRYIDKSFAYCPYCGFEFGRREEAAAYAEEPPLVSTLDPPPAEALAAASDAPERAPDYLTRLSDMQNRLTDMERELDLILSGTPQAEKSRG
jgi:hypothetical protein